MKPAQTSRGRNLLLGTLAITLLATQIHAQSWLTNGLVAYYPFNGDANDASGNGRHGSIHGATPVEDHALTPGAAYRLNGTTDYIYFGRVLPDMQTFTVAAWVKSYGGGTFFGDADWASANDFTIALGSQDTVIRCDKPPFSTFATVPLNTQIEGTWRHMAWVVTSSSIRVYVDGVLSGITAVGGGDVGFHNFVIGTQEFPQGNLGWLGYWRGDVSELRIYSRALTYDQMATISGRSGRIIVTIQVADVDVCWNTDANTTYQPQYRSELTTNQWVDLGTPIAGSGTTNCIRESVTSPRRFYRVVTIP